MFCVEKVKYVYSGMINSNPMGRKKIDIKPLPTSHINSSFNQQKKGLMKKAWELGILYHCKVVLIVFHPQQLPMILNDLSINESIDEILHNYATFY